jgi:hypothetical protein
LSSREREDGQTAGTSPWNQMDEAPRPRIYLLERAAAGEAKRKAAPEKGRRAATKALAKRALLLLGMLADCGVCVCVCVGRVSGESVHCRSPGGRLFLCCKACAFQAQGPDTGNAHKQSNRNKCPIPTQTFAVRWPSDPRRSDAASTSGPCSFLRVFTLSPCRPPRPFSCKFWVDRESLWELWTCLMA